MPFVFALITWLGFLGVRIPLTYWLCLDRLDLGPFGAWPGWELGLIGACGTVAFSVAAPALVPSLVPADALPQANGRIELARTTAFAAGPALGGALCGWIGGGPAFALAAALSIAAVILLLRIEEPARAPAPAQHQLRDLREGAAFVLGHPLLRPILLTQFIFNTALFVIMAVYVPYAIHALGLTATGVGQPPSRRL